MRLAGTVQGEIHATGDVEVDDAAKVNASLVGSDVNIRGHVRGPVTARKRLVVAKSGSLTGDVRVARLVIQDGASFSGNVSMGQPATITPTPEPPAAATSVPETAPKTQSAPADGKAKGKPKR